MTVSTAGNLARAAPLIANADHAEYLRRSHFGSLDGLRCISILAVIWHHTGASASSWSFLQHGYLGVALFFVISGYLITTLLLREKSRAGDISLRQFYLRRTLRIFPLYYTVLLLYVVLVWLFERDSPAGNAFFANLPYFATYTSNWFVNLDGERVILYFVWSLAAEEQFYLLWPAIEKKCRPAMTVMIMVAAIVIVTLVANQDRLQSETLGYRILTSFPIPIGLGVLLAHALHHPAGFRVLAPLFGQRAAAPIMLLLLVSMLIPATPSPWAVYAAMTALVASTVMREDHLLAPLMKWRPVVHIGVVSYGLYLLHMLSYRLVSAALVQTGMQSAWLSFAATTAVAVLAATLSYRYYESYFLRLKVRLSKRPLSVLQPSQ